MTEVKKEELINDFDAFFDKEKEISIDDFELPEEDGGSGIMVYSPKATDGTNDKYFSVIRLLPDPKRIMAPIQKRLQVYIDSPELGITKYVDSKENFLKGSCPIQKRFWYFFNMKKTQPHIYEMRNKVSANESYYCLAQVVKDKQRPELEGKVVVYKFNLTINKIINDAMKPSKEKLEVGAAKPLNPFDVFKSKNLIIDLTVKGTSEDGSRKYTDYSQVKFMEEYTAVKVTNEDGEKEEITKSARGKELMNILYTNAPTLEDFKPIPWDEETEKLVNEWLDSLPPTNKISKNSKADNIPSKPKLMDDEGEDDEAFEEDESTDVDDLEDFLKD